MKLQTILTITIRVTLGISGVCMAYLLFVFGHTELTPQSYRTAVACVAAISALIGGTLMWVGLPADPNAPAPKKGPKKRSGK